MRSIKFLVAPLVLAASVFAFPTFGTAEPLRNKIVVTFNHPVEVPGLVLAAGSYIFKTPTADSHVLQIWDSKETHLYTTLFTATRHRVEATDTTIAIFDERAAGSPQALKTLFAPGEISGEEFLY